MSNPGTPIVNAPSLYLQGMQLVWLSNTTLSVNVGQARDSSNTNDIFNYGLNNGTSTPTATTFLTINAANNGANGLDVGALANNTYYGVYIIGDSGQFNPTAAILSSNLVAPSLPYGYDMYRRLGYVLTNGAAHILKFWQTNSGSSRKMWYDAPIEVVTAGTSASYLAVSLVTAVPLTAPTDVTFAVQLTPTAAGDAVGLRPTGATSTFGYANVSGDVTAVQHIDSIVCPTGIQVGPPVIPSIDYVVVGSVNLFVAAYVDQL